MFRCSKWLRPEQRAGNYYAVTTGTAPVSHAAPGSRWTFKELTQQNSSIKKLPVAFMVIWFFLNCVCDCRPSLAQSQECLLQLWTSDLPYFWEAQILKCPPEIKMYSLSTQHHVDGGQMWKSHDNVGGFPQEKPWGSDLNLVPLPWLRPKYLLCSCWFHQTAELQNVSGLQMSQFRISRRRLEKVAEEQTQPLMLIWATTAACSWYLSLQTTINSFDYQRNASQSC